MKTRAARFHERLAALRAIRALPAMAVLAVAILLLSLAVHSPQLNAFDRAATHTVQWFRSPLLDRWAIACTFMGNTATLVTLAFLVAVVLASYGRYAEAALTLLSLLALPLNLAMKELFDRPRPTEEFARIVLPALGFSFPSGHAMSSAAFYGCLAYNAWVIVANRKARNVFVACFTAMAMAVGLSRIYVGAHWFSDVLGGWTAGAFFLILLAVLYEPVAMARRKVGGAEGEPHVQSG